jgi:hypothetical protein
MNECFFGLSPHDLQSQERKVKTFAEVLMTKKEEPIKSTSKPAPWAKPKSVKFNWADAVSDSEDEDD